jgi:hypothetical protein
MGIQRCVAGLGVVLWLASIAGCSSTNPPSAPSGAPASLGDWTVTLVADGSCTEIPEAVRARRYMGSSRRMGHPPHVFELDLQSETLFAHWSNNILVSVSGTEARFEIESWDWGIGIAEDLGESKQLFIWGEGSGSADDSRMVGILTGGFEYTDYSSQVPVGVKCQSFRLEAVRG